MPMIKCMLCKYKKDCLPEMEYKRARRIEREKFQRWYGNYKKGKDKDESNSNGKREETTYV